MEILEDLKKTIDLDYGVKLHPRYVEGVHEEQFENLVCSPARGNGGTVVHKFLLNSNHLEAIGSDNNIYIAAKTDSTAGTPNLRWGGDTTGEFTNLVMKVTALPVALTTGSYEE